MTTPSIPGFVSRTEDGLTVELTTVSDMLVVSMFNDQGRIRTVMLLDPKTKSAKVHDQVASGDASNIVNDSQGWTIFETSRCLIKAGIEILEGPVYDPNRVQLEMVDDHHIRMINMARPEDTVIISDEAGEQEALVEKVREVVRRPAALESQPIEGYVESLRKDNENKEHVTN